MDMRDAPFVFIPRAGQPPPAPAETADGMGFRFTTSYSGTPAQNVGCVTLLSMFPPGTKPSGRLKGVLLSAGDVYLEQLRAVIPCNDSGGGLVPLAVLGHGRIGGHTWTDARAKLSMEQIRAELLCSKITYHQVPVQQRGKNHARFVISVYENGLLLSISGSNLTFAETTMCQTVWQQYFRKLRPDEPDDASPFHADLQAYLLATGWGGMQISGDDEYFTAWHLKGYKFADAKGALVTVVPGKHQGAALRSYGHLALRRLLSAASVDPCFVGSSIALCCPSVSTLQAPMLAEQIASFGAGTASDGRLLGVPNAAHTAFVWPTAHSRIGRSGLYFTKGDTKKEALVNFAKLVGPQGVAHLCLPAAPVDASPDVAYRAQIGSHAKLYVRHTGDDIAWVLMGSSNWGKTGLGERPKDSNVLKADGFEMNVLILPKRGEYVLKQATASRPAGLRDGVLALRIPFALPPVRYDASDPPFTSSKGW